jgi:hypothetical protein
MDTNDALVDIYALDKFRLLQYSTFEGGNCTPDYSNVIWVSETRAHNFPRNEKGEFMCSECSITTFFLHDSSMGYICPRCMSLGPHLSRTCSICLKKQDCDSCGGIASKMVSIGNLTLCSQDRCLMPFGYYFRNDSLACSCERDILNDLRAKLPKVLCFIIDKMVIQLPRAEWMSYYLYTQGIRLGDLSITDTNRCTLCYIARKYKRVNLSHVERGKWVVCDCR